MTLGGNGPAKPGVFGRIKIRKCIPVHVRK